MQTGSKLYRIDQNIEPYPSPIQSMLEENKLLSGASRSVEGPSENIAGTSYQTLEERLKPELPATLKNRELEAAIEIFTTIALTTGVEYNDSGYFYNAFGKLVREVRRLRGYKYKNIELHNALAILVKEGYIAQGRALTGYKGPILIATSKIDPYLENVKQDTKHEKSHHHSLGEILHLPHHHKKNNTTSQ